MAQKQRKYILNKCRDCDEDFLAARVRRRKPFFCPICGENRYVDQITDLSIERPFLYKRKWTKEEDQLILVNHRLGVSDRELADQMENRTTSAIKARRLRVLRDTKQGEQVAKERADSLKRKLKRFRMYKGDVFICEGTFKEMAEQLGIQYETVKGYASPSYAKKIAERKTKNAVRMELIELEGKEPCK